MIPNKIVTIFISIVLAVGAIFLAILSMNAWKASDYIGVSEEQRHSITVTGEGEVVGVPDIAKIQLGYTIEKSTVVAAQKDNTEKINQTVEKLKKDFDINKKDIKTSNYNISPMYNWYEGKRTVRGYQVRQNINVKIRDLDKVGDILQVAGDLGLNQINNLSFEIDEPESLKQEAREEAIKEAKEKAESMAEVVGVKLGRIINFSEHTGSPSAIYETAYKGLDMARGSNEIAPSIEVGSTEININVSIEYEIL